MSKALLLVYDGGTAPNPTYETVSAGGSGYSEVVQSNFDNKKITYSQVVNYFLHHVDPTNNIGQFCDTGSQYKKQSSLSKLRTTAASFK